MRMGRFFPLWLGLAMVLFGGLPGAAPASEDHGAPAHAAPSVSGGHHAASVLPELTGEPKTSEAHESESHARASHESESAIHEPSPALPGDHSAVSFGHETAASAHSSAAAEHESLAQQVSSHDPIASESHVSVHQTGEADFELDLESGLEPVAPMEFILSIHQDTDAAGQEPVYILVLEMIYNELVRVTVGDVMVWWQTPQGEELSIPVQPLENSYWAVRINGDLGPGVHQLRLLVLLQGPGKQVAQTIEQTYELRLPDLILTRTQTRQLSEQDQAVAQAHAPAHEEAIDQAVAEETEPAAAQEEETVESPAAAGVSLGKVFVLFSVLNVLLVIALAVSYGAWKHMPAMVREKLLGLISPVPVFGQLAMAGGAPVPESALEAPAVQRVAEPIMRPAAEPSPASQSPAERAPAVAQAVAVPAAMSEPQQELEKTQLLDEQSEQEAQAVSAPAEPPAATMEAAAPELPLAEPAQEDPAESADQVQAPLASPEESIDASEEQAQADDDEDDEDSRLDLTELEYVSPELPVFEMTPDNDEDSDSLSLTNLERRTETEEELAPEILKARQALEKMLINDDDSVDLDLSLLEVGLVEEQAEEELNDKESQAEATVTDPPRTKPAASTKRRAAAPPAASNFETAGGEILDEPLDLTELTF